MQQIPSQFLMIISYATVCNHCANAAIAPPIAIGAPTPCWPARIKDTDAQSGINLARCERVLVLFIGA
jgi:hypothetical protein